MGSPEKLKDQINKLIYINIALLFKWSYFNNKTLLIAYFNSSDALLVYIEVDINTQVSTWQ